MTELHLLSGAGTTAATAAADALVVGVLPARADDDGEKGAPRLAPGAAAVDAAFDGELASLLALAGATGSADEIVRIPTRGTVTAPLLVAVGLGPAGDDGPSAEQVRRASGAAARALAGTDHAVTTLSWPGADAVAATAEGSLLGAYAFTEYKSARGRTPVRRVDPHHGRRRGRRGRAAPGDRGRRRPSPPRATWSTPHPTTCSPRPFAARAAALGEAAGLEVEVLDDAALAGGRVRRHPRGRRRLVAQAAGWCGCAGPVVRHRGRRWRWSARASRSTPAASRSSPPPHMDHMTSDMARRGRGGRRRRCSPPRLELPVDGHRDRADGREHAVGDGVPARRRAADVRRPDGRGAQHGRRGPAHPGRRDRPGRWRTSPTT